MRGSPVMRRIGRSFPHFGLGCILRRRFGGSESRPVRDYSRGPLPWEKAADCPAQPAKKCKRKVETAIQEKYCPYECEVLKRPKRNTYEWVVEDGPEPCKPFGMKRIVRTTVCEMRKLQKCIKMFGSECPQCRDVAVDCAERRKVYPMLDATQKGSLPGCAKPIPELHKQNTSKNQQDK